jgi:asparagine synthase (glutamine-hydrolysing)
MALHALNSSESIQTGQFGGFCPYWTVVDGQVLVADTAEEIILALPEGKRVIDPVAVLELLQFNYMLGNRTLVQGVQRMPWRATLRGDGVVGRRPPLPHANRYVSPQDVAQTLRELLEEELYNITRNYQRVFLLLSGGLDSRVVAGVLKKIEPQLQAQIACVTWGHPESRDVVYARRIASWYDWGFFHVPYDHELGWSNILRGAIWGGSEATGIHLHGMEWFRNVQPEDLVIASSFGDSVGRAEFGSVHVKKLSLALLQNPGRLLHPSLIRINDLLTLAEKDRETAWQGEQTAPDWVRCELDMQENYMRRMLCHPMDYIRQFCSLHQAFTSDEVVSYMWSLSPDCRTDEIYHQLLKDLDFRLYSLPWARTGVAPNGTIDPDPKLRKEYHEWGKWLRHDLRPRLEPLVFSPGLNELGLFYGPAIRYTWDRFLAEPDDRLGTGENVVKLCSIELSHRHFKIRPCRNPTYWQDVISDIVWRGLRQPRSIGSRGFRKARRILLL